MYVFFTGRIGKDAEIVTGSFGTFMSMDLAVEEFEKGETVTSWVRVRSQMQQHITLSKYLKKGKMIVVEGILKKPYKWTDKEGNLHIQQNVTANSIQFLSVGRKKEASKQETAPEPVNTDAKNNPNVAPPEVEDLPF